MAEMKISSSSSFSCSNPAPPGHPPTNPIILRKPQALPSLPGVGMVVDAPRRAKLAGDCH